MYHVRLKGNHYEIGYQWGSRLFEHGKLLLDQVPFVVTREQSAFAQECRVYYEEWYPEVLEEIRGIAQGQRIGADQLEAVLFSMYCLMPEPRCSCFAFRDGARAILARNSDFLTEIEKLYMNCIYQPEGGSCSFQGNTTAFVEMEDGVNEYGLAIGLTSVYPKVLGYGLNAGMLLRYGLEKCRTVEEFIMALEKAAIASSQTFIAADRQGAAALIECNAKDLQVRYLEEGRGAYVSAVNSFHLDEMKAYRMEGIDDWEAERRYGTIADAFDRRKEQDGIAFAMEVLSGEYGFICQYDRKTGRDTVWSAVYDVGGGRIYRCEGNPSRKAFHADQRF